MKTPLIILAALALCLSGCIGSFDTARLKGFNATDFRLKQTFPGWSQTVTAHDIHTDSVSGTTTVESFEAFGTSPATTGDIVIDGLVLPANQPAPVLTASGPAAK